MPTDDNPDIIMVPVQRYDVNLTWDDILTPLTQASPPDAARNPEVAEHLRRLTELAGQLRDVVNRINQIDPNLLRSKPGPPGGGEQGQRAAISILSTAPPMGKSKPPTPYEHTFSAKGGQPPYRFQVAVPAALPPGLTLSAEGVLSGTPTTSGRFNFLVIARDSAGASSHPHTFTIVIG